MDKNNCLYMVMVCRLLKIGANMFWWHQAMGEFHSMVSGKFKHEAPVTLGLWSLCDRLWPKATTVIGDLFVTKTNQVWGKKGRGRLVGDQPAIGWDIAWRSYNWSSTSPRIGKNSCRSDSNKSPLMIPDWSQTDRRTECHLSHFGSVFHWAPIDCRLITSLWKWSATSWWPFWSQGGVWCSTCNLLVTKMVT